ncbi:MAG TPA: DnaB-like helicase C-terminal domain-containing protein [Marmoricola sp.]|nr:DnaB-like helicase C-terminal domain-containing protein [Marmoricola sp.]
MTRVALLIATSEYTDDALANLQSPCTDSNELEAVLKDPTIGGYDTTAISDAPYHQIGERAGSFLAARRPEDEVVLFISGHAVRNDDGHLYFAGTNTRLDQVEDTSFAASALARQLDRCRAERILILLDCCYAGTFPTQGAFKSGARVDFEGLAGRGRVVIAGSAALQLAYEGAAHSNLPSVFTQAVLVGLQSGDADMDRDGIVSPNDLWAYVTEAMSTTVPRQTPVLKTDGLEGSWAVAKNPFHNADDTARVEPKRTAEVAAIATPTREALPLAETMEAVLDRIEAASSRKNLAGALPSTFSTGLEVLDEATGGLRSGDLVLITGPPESGRSTLALGIARATAIRGNHVCLLISSEMSAADTQNRILAAEARIPVHFLDTGGMREEDWARLARTIGAVAAAPLFIQEGIDGPIEVECAAFAERHGAKVIVIDSLELLSKSRDSADLLTISRALRLMARQLDIVVIATWASDSRGLTGDVDRYADVVIEITRPEQHDREDRPGEAELFITRNRRGPKRGVTVLFQGHYARFVDFAENNRPGF